MGVLDDAIREHLELKRQHGAAADEVARAEAEALGPARRPAAPDADDDDEAGSGPDETVVIEPVEDVAPPPDAADRQYDAERPASGDPDVPEGATRAVHDIDEDPFPPPAGADVDAPTEVHRMPVDDEPVDDRDDA